MSQNEAPGHGASLLVVEDEPQMQFLLTENLEFEGYSVTTADSGEAALLEIAKRRYSLMILDLMLPGMSGFEVCREVRARGRQLPIIVLTARSAESDRVIGLDLGADDYVTKPFGVRELLARVRAQLRREADRPEAHQEFVIGEVHIDLRRRLVTRRGRRLEVSTREFELLRYFLAHRGEVVSREQLLRDVWGYNQLVVTRTVDKFVAKLRCHIEPRPHDPRYFITLHGSGYQLVC
jgi:two-component system alkaline phosphatase synthesis response regulator PhoP